MIHVNVVISAIVNGQKAIGIHHFNASSRANTHSASGPPSSTVLVPAHEDITHIDGSTAININTAAIIIVSNRSGSCVVGKVGTMDIVCAATKVNTAAHKGCIAIEDSSAAVHTEVGGHIANQRTAAIACGNIPGNFSALKSKAGTVVAAPGIDSAALLSAVFGNLAASHSQGTLADRDCAAVPFRIVAVFNQGIAGNSQMTRGRNENQGVGALMLSAINVCAVQCNSTAHSEHRACGMIGTTGKGNAAFVQNILVVTVQTDCAADKNGFSAAVPSVLNGSCHIVCQDDLITSFMNSIRRCVQVNYSGLYLHGVVASGPVELLARTRTGGIVQSLGIGLGQDVLDAIIASEGGLVAQHQSGTLNRILRRKVGFRDIGNQRNIRCSSNSQMLDSCHGSLIIIDPCAARQGDCTGGTGHLDAAASILATAIGCVAADYGISDGGCTLVVQVDGAAAIFGCVAGECAASDFNHGAGTAIKVKCTTVLFCVFIASSGDILQNHSLTINIIGIEHTAAGIHRCRSNIAGSSNILHGNVGT